MTASKIQNREQLVPILASLRASGKKVGFTSGVFDLLHPGHIDYLNKANALCDVLVVGVNSDSSVRLYKEPERPINPAEARVAVLSALSSVDFVFLFDDRNNNRNIELLKPDCYIKAGDYSIDKLSSASIVESYGGKVEIVPMLKGFSTSETIDRILSLYHASSIELPLKERRPALFLDRDGTIIEHIEYLHEPSKVKAIPGALEAIKFARQKGYRIVVITNQPGIGLGYFTKEDLFAVNRELLKACGSAGAEIDRIYFCPHSKADGCSCRKPGSALVERAERELNIDIQNSYIVGDMTSDLELGRRVGCKTVLVKTGRGGDDLQFPGKIDLELPSLADLPKLLPEAKVNPASAESRESDITSSLGPEALEAIGKIGGKIGHDFNNILGSMMGCADIINLKLKKLFPEANPLERQVTILQSAIAKGVELTSKIRGYVRPGPLVKHQTTLSSCVDSVISILNRSSETSFEIATEYRADPPMELADFQINQMLTSLIMNGVDAMKSQSERMLLIYMDKEDVKEPNPREIKPGSYLLLSIVDHGRGIGAEQKSKIFKPFYSTKHSGVGQGFGLSLAMAQEIMRKHNGKIFIDSLESVGTTVRLYFPLP